MSWIKTRDMEPPTHNVILFQDKNGSQHYGVLCGEFSEKDKRGKYWCHVDQRSFHKKDIVYWCRIPLNQDLVTIHMDLSEGVNKFLNDTYESIESSILKDFDRIYEENPGWATKDYVSIAVRNTLHRFSQKVQGFTL